MFLSITSPYFSSFSSETNFATETELYGVNQNCYQMADISIFLPELVHYGQNEQNLCIHANDKPETGKTIRHF